MAGLARYLLPYGIARPDSGACDQLSHQRDTLSAFGKDCPQCGQNNAAYAVTCRCGYSFSGTVADENDSADTPTVEEEQLYLEYLGARAQQAAVEARNAQAAAAAHPHSRDKANAAKVAQSTAERLRAEFEAQKASFACARRGIEAAAAPWPAASAASHKAAARQIIPESKPAPSQGLPPARPIAPAESRAARAVPAAPAMPAAAPKAAPSAPAPALQLPSAHAEAVKMGEPPLATSAKPADGKTSQLAVPGAAPVSIAASVQPGAPPAALAGPAMAATPEKRADPGTAATPAKTPSPVPASAEVPGVDAEQVAVGRTAAAAQVRLLEATLQRLRAAKSAPPPAQKQHSAPKPADAGVASPKGDAANASGEPAVSRPTPAPGTSTPGRTLDTPLVRPTAPASAPRVEPTPKLNGAAAATKVNGTVNVSLAPAVASPPITVSGATRATAAGVSRAAPAASPPKTASTSPSSAPAVQAGATGVARPSPALASPGPAAPESLGARPIYAGADPTKKECPNCTAVLSASTERCRCGFKFAKVEESIPSLSLSDSDVADLTGNSDASGISHF